MGKKSLEKVYNELVQNLWIDLVFYIPANDITKQLVSKLEGIAVTGILDKTYIVDKMLGPIVYTNESSFKALMKTTMLEDNMFLLLRKKRKLSPQEFNYVFGEYFEQVEVCFYITNWIHQNISTKSDKQISNSLVAIFELQYKGYKKHFEKLVQHFYPNKEELPKGNFNVVETIEKYFPNLFNEQKDTKITAIVIPTKATTQKDKKQLLITEQEAEAFLLESVFNIN